MLLRTVILATVFVALAPPAHADDQARARASYHEASKRYRLGEYQQALDGFKAAYLAYPDGAFLFNIGQCERQLDHKAEAVRAYRSYLAEVPDAPNAAEVRQLIDNLDAQLRPEAAGKSRPPTDTIPPTVPPAATAPPATTTAPAVTMTTAPVGAVAATAPPPARQPVYKKWWLWTAVAVVAVGVGVGVGVGLGVQPQNPSPTFGGVRY